MARRLIDTSILIDMFRGHVGAAQYVSAAINSREACLHPLVAAEILAGSRNRREMAQFDRALSVLQPVASEAADWDACLTLFRTLHLAHGIGWEDCLIAATALRLKLDVATLNDKHFQAVPGLQVVRPY
jgi:predicted nucleic acid-binding protein